MGCIVLQTVTGQCPHYGLYDVTNCHRSMPPLWAVQYYKLSQVNASIMGCMVLQTVTGQCLHYGCMVLQTVTGQYSHYGLYSVRNCHRSMPPLWAVQCYKLSEANTLIMGCMVLKTVIGQCPHYGLYGVTNCHESMPPL